ncbi:MAG: efflux RND transporter periplasmic adaptor subunit [Gammaproteobacteria bacterium]
MYRQTLNATRIICLTAPLALALSACGVGEASVTAEPPEATPITVVTSTARRGEAFAVYAGTVNLEAEGEAAVVAKVAGEIVEVLVEEGDAVVSGQVLARLDGDKLQLMLDQALADLNQLKQEYRRNVQLHERGLVSEGAFENLRFQLDALDAAYRLARLELAYTEIRAPIDGVVTERMGRAGNTAMVGEPVFRISSPDKLVAYLHVPQKDLYQFEAGQTARLTLDALPGEEHTARVLRISPSIDAGSGTFRITLEIDSQTQTLRAGMFARVQVVYDVHSDAILVPLDALLEEDAETAVFVFEDGVAKRRVVGTGLASDESVEVLTGLQGSEEIIVVGQAGLKDGTPVTRESAGHQI